MPILLETSQNGRFFNGVNMKKQIKCVSIPVLSIVEESVDLLFHKNVNKLALLATGSTINSKLFDAKLKNSGIEFEIPNKISQQKIEVIIDRLLAKRESGSEKA